MKKLAVIGPGLLGGSIALAAQRLPGLQVSVWARRAAAVEDLRARKLAATVSTELAEVARDADLVVLCVPIGAMPALAAELAVIVPSHAIVTDVGSVKGPVVGRLAPLFGVCGTFVGSHPMAGSEQTGIEAARADLFVGSVCIVTPVERTPPEAVRTVSEFWESLGCRVRQLPPDEHDEIAALISHSPHLVAAALVHAAAGQPLPAFDFVGPGFRDTTRVASGPPEMWAEILKSNRVAVRRSVDAVIEKLREFTTLLDLPSPASDLRMNEFLAQAKAQRDRLRPPAQT